MDAKVIKDYLLSYKGAFNNYVDQILTIFDPLPPPRVDKSGHFTKKNINNLTRFNQHNAWINLHTL